MNCSARSRGSERGPSSAPVGLVYSIAAALLFAFASDARSDSMEELDDAAARIQYAFYSADPRSLKTVLAQLEELVVGAELSALKSYQLAYGFWRLAQLITSPSASNRAAPGARAQSAQAAQACERHVRTTITADERLAEAYAIQAVCDGFSPTAEQIACRSRPLRTSLSMAPENPRVRLIEALCAGDEFDLVAWRKVVELFETAAPPTSGAPDWGYAEALCLLGERYLQRGDPIAARDALERALVIAPDYRDAQALLQAAAARPR